LLSVVNKWFQNIAKACKFKGCEKQNYCITDPMLFSSFAFSGSSHKIVTLPIPGNKVFQSQDTLSNTVDIG